MGSINLLLLADGRLPAGGYAHSGGVETAVANDTVTDLETLRRFLTGRLHTAGAVAAGLAAAACSLLHPWEELEAEADARTPSPAQRAASRRQGRQMLRAARTLWPGGVLEGLAAAAQSDGPHQAVALGAAAASAGLKPVDAAQAAVFNAVTGPASAAVRLLGLDPLGAAALTAGMTAAMDDVARAAAAGAAGPLRELPCCSSILLDLYAEQHAKAEVTLFAS